MQEIPWVKFNFDDEEECGMNIGNLIIALRLSTPKTKELNTEIKKSSSEFRKKLVDMQRSCMKKGSEATSYQRKIQLYKKKNNSLLAELTNLGTANSNLSTENDGLKDVIRSLYNTINEKDLKLNQNMLEKEEAKQKMALLSREIGQELDLKLKKQRDHLNAALKTKDVQLQKIREALEAEILIDPNELKTDNLPPHMHENTSSYFSMKTGYGYASRHRRPRSADEEIF
ncbi:hypothetical protein JTB14_027934 [Gonioctena quinquepunctata]|nr:hypothetical protein JTB14_027934 [Gonioctena quinquepunctata]